MRSSGAIVVVYRGWLLLIVNELTDFGHNHVTRKSEKKLQKSSL